LHPTIAKLDIRWLVAGLIGSGGALRIWHYAGDRSFWLDELFLALNLRARSFAELAAPLDWDQMAPLGFLWAEKLALTCFGESGYALRAPSLLASLLTLALTYPVARQLLSRAGAAVALALCALLPGTVYFAAELKPYAFDEFAALGLTGLALACARDGSRRWLAALGVAGLVAPWLSYPAAFVLAAVGSGLVLKFWRDRDRPAAVAVACMSVAWLASFTLHLVYSGAAASPTPAVMRQFWHWLFMPSPVDVQHWTTWMATWVPKAFGFVQQFGLTQTLDASLLALLLAALGVIALRRGGWHAVLLLGPLVAALLASALHLYPFGGRFLAYFSPALGLLVGAGLVSLRAQSPHGLLIALAAGGLLIGPMVLDTLRNASRSPPFAHEDTRPLWQTVRENLRPGDALYVNAKAVPSLEYYAADLQAVAAPVIVGSSAAEGFLEDVAQIRQHRRVWLLFSHLRPDDGPSDALILQALGEHARHVTVRSGDTALYAIEFR
jgi:hypothetical protein